VLEIIPTRSAKLAETLVPGCGLDDDADEPQATASRRKLAAAAATSVRRSDIRIIIMSQLSC
jgi:hypothetical protein